MILHLLKTGLAQTWHDAMVNGINDVQKLSKTGRPSDRSYPMSCAWLREYALAPA
jgi:hypothetical protein